MAGIAIDLNAAEGLALRLRRAAEDLLPLLRSGIEGIGYDAAFGMGSPSGELAATRDAYRQVTKTFTANMEKHLLNAHKLATWLEWTIAQYRQADAESAARMPDHDRTAATGDGADVDVGGYADAIPPSADPDRFAIPSTHSVKWTSYDVPRDAAILQGEGGADAHSQALAFKRLSETLDAHATKVDKMRSALAAVWSPQESFAAAQFQTFMITHIKALDQDSQAAMMMPRPLESIVNALKAARGEVNKLHTKWNDVTTDWTPEFWDNAAAELNQIAAQQLTTTDSIVREERGTMPIPTEAGSLPDPPDGTGSSRMASIMGGANTAPPQGSSGGHAGGSGSGGGAGQAGGGQYTVPPVPGRNPVAGPALAGAPMPVPISASNPPSMLPIQPGVSALAPTGGAWLLPGPGVGTQGRVLPMPPRAGAPGSGAAAGMRPAVAGSAGGAGVMAGSPGAGGGTGTAAGGIGGTGGAGSAAGGGRIAPGAGKEKWEVRQGVKPVIDSPDTQNGSSDQTIEDDTGFDAWFDKTATPWKAPGDQAGNG